MTNRRSVFFPFLALLVFVISVGCLCTGFTSTPTEVPAPTQPPVVPTKEPVQQPTEAPAPTQEPVTNNNSGGWTTFTDKNNFYVIDVPSDWTYQQTVDEEKNHFYIDTFTSPNGGAVIENIVYNDGTPFTGKQNGQFALYLLNTFYSKTGREGVIRVSDDKREALSLAAPQKRI